jgi:hypothetical protein
LQNFSTSSGQVQVRYPLVPMQLVSRSRRPHRTEPLRPGTGARSPAFSFSTYSATLQLPAAEAGHSSIRNRALEPSSWRLVALFEVAKEPRSRWPSVGCQYPGSSGSVSIAQRD